MSDRNPSFTRRFALSVVLILLALVAGGVGGVIGHRLDSTSAQGVQFGKDFTLPSGGIAFKTVNGKLVAKLDADENGGYLILYNAAEKAAATIGATQNGGGLIGLTNGKGAGDIIHFAGDESGARLVLLSTRGKPGIELTTNGNGGSVSVNGPTGGAAVSISTNESNRTVGGRIDLLESISGSKIWTAPPGAR